MSYCFGNSVKKQGKLVNSRKTEIQPVNKSQKAERERRRKNEDIRNFSRF